jgi:hypothetical protein
MVDPFYEHPVFLFAFTSDLIGGLPVGDPADEPDYPLFPVAAGERARN